MQNVDVLGDVAGRLGRAGLEYMLTGSMAVNFYAMPRMTRDIDLGLDELLREVAP